MHKFHFLYTIQRLQQKPKGPVWQDILIPFALFMGLLPALVGGDLHDFLEIRAEVWESVILGFALLSFGVTVVQFVRWCRYEKRNPVKTPEQIYDDVVHQMEQDRARIEEIERNRGRVG